ncbi:DUF952 domain-containing protein [Nocardioides nanhaiensis]|uniref:DUF952 domain-containing protein n=1 Tax=Nocardioides nanhaiensis TaxID=1476871 RepID=A0ABP8WZN1_9ACTN
MRLFHIATRADWEAARRSGRYTTSTYGVTLAEEGFIHASRADQWQGVRERFYAEVTEPLVLLVIDGDRLDVPVVEEAPPGAGPGAETFPHLYGALDPAAVVQVLPLEGAGSHARGGPGPGRSFSSLFLEELFHRLALAGIVLVLAALGAVLGAAVAGDVGLLAGTAIGVVAALPPALWVRRRHSPD